MKNRLKTNNNIVGKKISRKMALTVARKALIDAEKKREEFCIQESLKGTSFNERHLD